MEIQQAITTFLSAPAFAVAGASKNRSKYGNKILRCYLQNGRTAFPINPGCSDVEGHKCYTSISALPEPIESLSIITSPDVTARVVEEAIKSCVRNIWMQPGATHAGAIQRAEDAGLNVIAGGPCVLVVLGYQEEA
ncbi:CoA-binding protein [bacterium]|jgi:predicted CoA-binding protein|nr:CoA-binding protein [Gemmatimonadota bacterium]MCH2665664.1 CoA-binding protein [bacterium]